MADRDTICALASGQLPAALAIVRVSGPAVTRLILAHVSDPLPNPRTVIVTTIRDGAGRVLDEAVATWFSGPASYTGEDILELTLHGGPAIVSGVLTALTAHKGVRLAEPGEFTRRAVQAGKMDLIEAEAVADMVEAETAAQRDQALQHLGGSASAVFEGWHRRLLEAQAMADVSVDFPDEADAPEFESAPLDAVLVALQTEISSQLTGSMGERIRDGFRVALMGAPNAGKSSLLNRLAGRDAAIVTSIPGTTRDIVEVRLDLGGLPVWVSDTAGLRETSDLIEQEGVRRARRAASSADLVLHIIDGADASKALLEFPGMANVVRVWNKSDLGKPAENVSRETFQISALTGEGVDALVVTIADRLKQIVQSAPPALIVRARHREMLSAAEARISAARNSLSSGFGAEFVAEDIRSASRHLERLIGRIDVEDVLGSIFSQFCIGK